MKGVVDAFINYTRPEESVCSMFNGHYIGDGFSLISADDSTRSSTSCTIPLPSSSPFPPFFVPSAQNTRRASADSHSDRTLKDDNEQPLIYADSG